MISAVSTISYKFGNASRLYDAIANTEMYYLFVGDFLPHSNNVLQPLYENPSNTYISTYQNMIMGKFIANTDISFGVAYNPWVANTVFNMYDDQDANLSTELFFVIT